MDDHSAAGYDKARILRELGIPETVYDGIVRNLLDQVDGMAASLREAVERRDLERVRMMAHSIKGSSANLRITALSVPAAELEACAKENRDGTELCAAVDLICSRCAGLRAGTGRDL